MVSLETKGGSGRSGFGNANKVQSQCALLETYGHIYAVVVVRDDEPFFVDDKENRYAILSPVLWLGSNLPQSRLRSLQAYYFNLTSGSRSPDVISCSVSHAIAPRAAGPTKTG
jgi:hypothetical protein